MSFQIFGQFAALQNLGGLIKGISTACVYTNDNRATGTGGMSVARAGEDAAETSKQRLDIDLLRAGNESESANNEDSPLTLAQLPDPDPFMERILARPSSSPVQAISNERRTPRHNVREKSYEMQGASYDPRAPLRYL